MGILSFIALGLGVSVWGRYEIDRMTREKREELTLEREALEARASALSAEIQDMESERGLEGEVREKFEVGSPGEKLIVIVDPREESELIVAPVRKTFWMRLREWFAGL